ncbi:MAG: GNAT family N-acetyltransferase [Bacteroidia bacterium]|nr:GNAT family N-acetyltransferase [Bacteroidia bacterium]
MKYTQFDITIVHLKEEDIELVRQWRNSPQIAERMEFREYITPEMQKVWFKSISNLNNLYFVIIYHEEKIGVINVKNVDWKNRQLESGIFIPDEKFWGTFVPSIVSIMLTQMFFRIFGWDHYYAHIMKTNERAIKYNKSLGYELCEGEEENENQLYILKRENFEKRSEKLVKALTVIAEGDTSAVLQLEPEDLGTELEQFVEDNLPNIPGVTKIEENEQGRFYYLSV